MIQLAASRSRFRRNTRSGMLQLAALRRYRRGSKTFAELAGRYTIPTAFPDFLARAGPAFFL
ncbi:hypothetical protein H1230_16890 [Paenibacillus sp. 19GGS1-52]|uniref:hypothetical protein n=1 Tax=Paenibacillus sp. 19GGS1-52 TaxID=2758563 RepID=UPI001EFA77D5|nr:hypothetical protein [Paenibacillus sp. 19GGS1-52]ULO04823.1 hypothetical protein H1230_16890 [Paenibacillus sp. 19GGS1-52]